jgi:NAD(P)-dependent dehydrogenase (short-subunit alcohol dehydrogenase family)
LFTNRHYQVYALDRLETPSPDFSRIQKRAETELRTSLSYHRIDVRDVDKLNAIVTEIADKHGRMDGLIAAAGIQQETPALEYSAKDSDYMMSINVTGVFMTAQAVARQMVRFGNGGSVVLIASMSGTVANRVNTQPPPPFSIIGLLMVTRIGTHLPRLQRLKSSSNPTRPQFGK